MSYGIFQCTLSAIEAHTAIASRPPGRSAPARLRKADFGSAKNMTPKREVRRSTLPGGKAWVCASASSVVRLAMPCSATRRRNSPSIGSAMSIPVTWPVDPTAAASGKAVAPGPQPTSSTCSPGAALASARSRCATSILRASWISARLTQRGPATSFQYCRISALAASACSLILGSPLRSTPARRSGQPFLLHDPLHRRTRLHALVMRGAIRRQRHLEAAGGPELDVEQRRIGSRQFVAAEITLAGERLVEHGKALFDHLAAAGLHLFFGFGRTKIARPEDARETLPVHRPDRVFHRFHRAGFGLQILRDQLGLRVLPRQPPGDYPKHAQDRAVVAL